MDEDTEAAYQPAFPVASDNYATGMTLRDYFAANAMQAYITGGAYDLYLHEIADKSYGIAEAMVKARNK